MKQIRIKNIQVNGCPAGEDTVFTDTATPAISWQNETNFPGFRQTAYRILATCGDGRTIRDSGFVQDSNCRWIPWDGEEIPAGETITLTIQTAGEDGILSAPSSPVRIQMALPNNSCWGKSRWLWFDGNTYSTSAPSPFFRREFQVRQGLVNATLSITARGIFAASLDGQKISRDLLSPGWTDFKQHIPFCSYDLTEKLTPGTHALGATIADGWCCGNLTFILLRNFYHPHPELLAHLELKYSDGGREIICTDETWKVSTGPILSADLYDGEIYDARYEMPGWDSPGFDDSAWRNPALGEYASESPVLVPRTAPPVRITQELAPVAILRPKKDTYIWDFGQNFAGTYRIRLKPFWGRLYSFKTAEMLDEDGTIYTLNYRNARSQDTYIGAGTPEKTAEFTPEFTFHGFRYLQIDGFQFDNVKPEELEVTGLVTGSDMELKGQFTCGNALINRLWLNALWGQRSNFLEIPTDCPQRDERLGWTGDTQIFAPTAMLNMDCCAFYRKYLRDVREGMTEDGAAPSIAPAVLQLHPGAAGWGDAIILLPYELYKHYGWKDILEENYTAMKRSLAWQEQHSDGLIRPAEGNFADWLAMEETPRELVTTAYFAHCAACLSEIAGILGYSHDASRYAELAQKIRAAFQREFTNKDGMINRPTQSALVMGLAFDLIKPEHREKNADLLEKVIADNSGKISCGFLGTGLILPTLERFRRYKTACDLILQEEFPSWLFIVKQGATTIWERWNSYVKGQGFGDASMNSFNHYAYGACSSFLITGIGGIHYSHDGIVMKIIPDRRFSPVHAVYDSPYGLIESNWEIDSGGVLSWNMLVPNGIKAKAILPDGTEHELSPGSASFRVQLD